MLYAGSAALLLLLLFHMRRAVARWLFLKWGTLTAAITRAKLAKKKREQAAASLAKRRTENEAKRARANLEREKKAAKKEKRKMEKRAKRLLEQERRKTPQAAEENQLASEEEHEIKEEVEEEALQMEDMQLQHEEEQKEAIQVPEEELESKAREEIPWEQEPDAEAVQAAAEEDEEEGDEKKQEDEGDSGMLPPPPAYCEALLDKSIAASSPASPSDVANAAEEWEERKRQWAELSEPYQGLLDGMSLVEFQALVEEDVSELFKEIGLPASKRGKYRLLHSQR